MLNANENPPALQSPHPGPLLLFCFSCNGATHPKSGQCCWSPSAGSGWSSWQWARSIAKNTRITREMRFGWAQVGDRLEERFRIHNRGIFPLLNAEIEDHSSHAGLQPGEGDSGRFARSD
jgi:hypothetical protein